MIFSCHKEQERQQMLIDSQNRLISEMRSNSTSYALAVKNIQSMENREIIYVGLYVKDRGLYCMYLDDIYNAGFDTAFFGTTLYEFKLLTIDLNSCDPFHNLVAKSEIDVRKRDGKLAFELHNIDVSKSREGHGSQQIQKIKYIGKLFGIESIFGKVLPDTPIGIENLKNFYRKNGFEIHGEHFRMEL